jgi:hypothetical protein
MQRTAERAEFLAIVCADEELLRAEFEAIIENAWGEPPGRVPVRPARPPADRSAGTAEPRPPVPGRSDHADDHRAARQRGPPRRSPCPGPVRRREVGDQLTVRTMGSAAGPLVTPSHPSRLTELEPPAP